jgi:hypothetical protein
MPVDAYVGAKIRDPAPGKRMKLMISVLVNE